MFDNFFDIVAFIGTVALVGLSIFAFARKFLIALKGRKTAMRELESPSLRPSGKTMRAQVLSKRADTVYSGTPRFPKHELKFFVTFKVFDKSYEYEVCKELFERLKEGQNGILVTADDEFIDFDIG